MAVDVTDVLSGGEIDPVLRGLSRVFLSQAVFAEKRAVPAWKKELHGRIIADFIGAAGSASSRPAMNPMNRKSYGISD